MVSGKLFSKLNLIKSSTIMGPLLAAVLLFFAQNVLQKPSLLKPSDYLPPPQIIEKLSAGQKVQFADSFWLRAIQDFDYCDHPINRNECQGSSWLYKVIDLTTDLDKTFREAYYFGALSLSVLVSDADGAAKIFAKGVFEFPKNWPMLYAAGYHALFDEKNKLKASRLYSEAAKFGAPSWVHVLAGRLSAESGETEFAAKILEEMIATSQDPMLVNRLKQKLNEVQK